MQQDIAEVLSGPWAILPDRLPFVRAALLDVRSGGQRAIPQARTYAAANDATRRRQASNDAIAVLPFYGIAVQRTDAMGELLGLVSVQRFTQAFRAALADQAVRGIVIDMDSPGGSAYGVAELADEIYRSRARKPIFSVANSLAASGAYWIASAASEFYVTPGGEVGGIGVHDMHRDFSKGLEKAGIETTLIAAGKFKTEGNPFHPLGTNARAAMQKRVDGYYRSFVAAVAKHRNVPESAVRNGMGQGRVFGAERGLRENMVDGFATLDDVVRMLARRIGQGKAAAPSPRATQLHARQRVIEALSRRPSSGPPRTAMPAAARECVIDMLSL
ncbi:S49 family peptidase [Burkholderia pseudomallei]|nr:S49 family peptidase [Burkholderia pseudomallei]